MDADTLTKAISHLTAAGLQATVVADDRPALLRISGPLGTQTYGGPMNSLDASTAGDRGCSVSGVAGEPPHPLASAHKRRLYCVYA